MVNIGELYITILKLLILALVGFVLHRKNILGKNSLDFIAKFLVKVTVPSLIFIQLADNFSLQFRPTVGVFLLISVVIFLIGALIGYLAYFFKKNKDHHREVITLSAFQNAGYLPMNIVFFLFDEPIRNILLVYIFLYLFGFNILMWSIGSFFIFKQKKENFTIKSLFTPPILATLVILGLKLIFSSQLKVPELIYSPLAMLGKMSFPLSMIFLGASLSEAGKFVLNKNFLSEIFIVSVVRLIILPVLAIILVFKINLPILLGFFVILQASMPCAVSIPIITKYKDYDYKFTSQVVFLTHCLAIISIPFWLHIYMRFLAR